MFIGSPWALRGYFVAENLFREAPRHVRPSNGCFWPNQAICVERGCGLQVGHPGVRKGTRMYDRRAKRDALDLWFSMPGEMSVEDFAADLGYPPPRRAVPLDQGGSCARPRQVPVSLQVPAPKLEAIRRVAEGAPPPRRPGRRG